MSPDAFSFKLTVPNDPASVVVVTAVVTHAVEYANIDAGKRSAFMDRVRSAAETGLATRAHTHSPVLIAAADGRLTVTIGSHAESESLPS
jgi:hypothetical protein